MGGSIKIGKITFSSCSASKTARDSSSLWAWAATGSRVEVGMSGGDVICRMNAGNWSILHLRCWRPQQWDAMRARQGRGGYRSTKYSGSGASRSGSRRRLASVTQRRKGRPKLSNINKGHPQIIKFSQNTSIRRPRLIIDARGGPRYPFCSRFPLFAGPNSWLRFRLFVASICVGCLGICSTNISNTGGEAARHELGQEANDWLRGQRRRVGRRPRRQRGEPGRRTRWSPRTACRRAELTESARRSKWTTTAPLPFRPRPQNSSSRFSGSQAPTLGGGGAVRG